MVFRMNSKVISKMVSKPVGTLTLDVVSVPDGFDFSTLLIRSFNNVQYPRVFRGHKAGHLTLKTVHNVNELLLRRIYFNHFTGFSKTFLVAITLERGPRLL